jgi:type III secretion system FlhB-like substrate exporter
LVEALARLEVGTVIPRELSTVVAEVLAFVYAVDLDVGRA